MFRKNLILPVAATLCFLSPVTAVFAQDASTQTTKKVRPAKTIKFTVANNGTSPVSLKTGDQEVTIAAGKSQQIKATSGQQIVTTSESSLGAAGTVVSSVTDTMEGATVNVR